MKIQSLCITSFNFFNVWQAVQSIMSIVTDLFEDPRHDPVAAFLLQVFITLVLSKIFSKLLSFIHQPAVIGQILAGIVLGPSVLGFVPGFSLFVFSPHTLGSF